MNAICDAHKKKVGVELLYNSVHRKFNQSWRQDEVEKASTQQGSPQAPDLSIWKPDQLETRSGRESQHPAEEALKPPIEQLGSDELNSPGEHEKNAVMANRVGVNMLQFCSVSNFLSHTNLSNKVSGIFF